MGVKVNNLYKPQDSRDNDEMGPFRPALPEVCEETNDLDSLSQTCNWGQQGRHDRRSENRTHFICQYATSALLVQKAEPVDTKKLVAFELHILRKGLRLFAEEIFRNTVVDNGD